MDYQLWALYDQVMRLASLLGIPFAAVGAFFLIRSLRRTRAMTTRSLIVQLATPLVALVVYSALMPAPVSFFAAVAAFVVGAGIGAAWSLTVKLRAENGTVLGKRSVAYLGVWVVAFAVPQVFAGIAWYRWVGYTLPGLYLATGIAVGLNATLLVRVTQAAAVTQAPPPAPQPPSGWTQ